MNLKEDVPARIREPLLLIMVQVKIGTNRGVQVDKNFTPVRTDFVVVLEDVTVLVTVDHGEVMGDLDSVDSLTLV